MSTIRVQQLTKHFDDLVAVDHVDLDIGAGEVLCLLGPSGCGKTTTLRMIAGLEIPTAGDIYIAEKRVNHLSPSQRNIAMVFQFYALYPSLTVAQNLVYPLHAEKLSSHEITTRLQSIASSLALEHILERRPDQLGEGEKQRVAVGRAIIREPNCFLFDEPLSRLDIEVRQTMRGQIKEVLAGLSKAMVIVTHDQLEALTMADRIAVMRSGVIEQVATPHEIFVRPKNLFVAGFIGTPPMNLHTATLIKQDDTRACFQIGDQRTWLTVHDAVTGLPAGSPVTLGIRPRAYEIAPQAEPDTYSAVADLIEPMGAETLVHMVEGDRDVRVVVPRGQSIHLGERLHLRCKSGQALVFNATGELVQ